MIKLLQSPFVAMSLGGLTFLVSMFLMIQKPLAARAVAQQKQEEPDPGFWTQHNPEADQLLQELKKQKQTLDKREADLKELQTRLEAERAELNVVTQRVTQMQMEFDQNVIRIKEEEAPNLKKLARMYSSMSPEGASAILKELDDQVVVKVLSFMKEAESAPLLESMAKQGDEQAKRAAMISEALRKTFAEKRTKP
jgi:flagellar motility protein MotE (MotC chaperone)